MLTATTPIIIKLQEIVKRYNTKKRKRNSLMEVDHDVEYKYWPHPADAVKIEEIVSDEEATIHAFTDGTKQEKGVGAGAVVFKGSELVAKVQQKLDNRCSNNQAEQLAILKVLETIESMNSHNINPRTVMIYTDSRVSLDLLHNPNNHAYLAEEIRKKVASMVRAKWKIKFLWVKAHAGIYGNEMVDRLAKEAARSNRTKYGYSRIPISAIYREAA
jgi:ribonuclease HI